MSNLLITSALPVINNMISCFFANFEMVSYLLWWVMTHYYKQVRFVVVGNILRSDISIHKKFNLGISPQGRLVSKAGAEEDLNVAFHLHAAVRHLLLR